jgi:hypothetical protein
MAFYPGLTALKGRCGRRAGEKSRSKPDGKEKTGEEGKFGKKKL